MRFHEVPYHVPVEAEAFFKVSERTCCCLQIEQDCMLLYTLICGSVSGMPATERAVHQEHLIGIILEVLKRNPQLHYYQGYHDVAVSLLLVVGERMAIAMLETLSNYHLRLNIYVLFYVFLMDPINQPYYK